MIEESKVNVSSHSFAKISDLEREELTVFFVKFFPKLDDDHKERPT